jgi:hypothetical protein
MNGDVPYAVGGDPIFCGFLLLEFVVPCRDIDYYVMYSFI